MNRCGTDSDQRSKPSRLTRLFLLIYALITTATAALLVTFYLRGGCHDVLILIKSGPWSNLQITLAAVALGWLLLGSILILLHRRRINAGNLIPFVCFYLLAFLYLNIMRERPFFGDIGDYIKAAINVNDAQPFHPRYLYPPFLAMSLSLLTRYGSEFAIDTFALSNYIGLLIFIPLLLASLMKYGVPRNTAALAVFILLSVNVPLLRTIGFGQVNLHACNLILLSFLLYGRNLLFSALALSLAVHIKASPVVLILPFLFCRDWKWLSAFAGISAGILLLTGVVFGFHYYTDFLTNASNLYTANNMSYRDNSFDSFFMASYYILDLDIPKAKYPIAVAKMILLLTSAIIGLRGVRNRSFCSDNGPQGVLWNSAVPLLFLMTMLSPLVWEHHFIFVCLPFLVLLKRASGASELALFFVSYYLVYLVPTFDFYPVSYARLLGVILFYIVLWRTSRRTAGGLSDFDRIEGSLESNLKAISETFCSRDTTR
jgi:hypothetical protein